MNQRSLLATILVVSLLGVAICDAALSVPLTVRDHSTVARTAEPVRSGVPIPRSAALMDVTDLRLVGPAGVAVPARFTALGRWGAGPADPGAPVRWVQVEFRADVPAGGAATYTLLDGGAGPAPAALAMVETAAAVEVTTGPARFLVSKSRGTIIESAWLDLDSNGVFAASELALAPAADTGSFVVSAGMEYRAAASAPASVTVEDGGPERATIRIEGYHRAGGTPLLRYVTRLTFFAGESYVRVQHTIIEGRVMGSGNGGWPGGIVETALDRGGLRLRLALSGPVTARVNADGTTPRTLALAGGATVSVRQRPTYDWQLPLAYEVRSGASVIETGERARAAWLDLADATRGMAVSTRDFWRKSPQGLGGAADGSVTIEFPSEPYTIMQGMGFMEDLVLDLHPASTSVADLHARAQGLSKDPLFAAAPSSWYVASGAFGELRGAASSRYPAYEQVMADQRSSTLAWIDEGHAFGLMNYLDVPTDHYDGTPDPQQLGWGNSYYDPAGAQIREFARTGDDLWLRDLAGPLVRHHYSIDCYDTDDPTWYMNGISGARGVYHRGAWTGEYHYLESLWPYYYLTGDRRALERGLAAARSYADQVEWDNDYGLGGGYPGLTTRMMAQKLSTLVEGYLASGDAGLRAVLVADAEDFLRVWGTPEHFFRDSREQLNPYETDQGFMATLLYLDALWRYHQLTGSPAARAKLATTPRRILDENRIDPDPTSPDYLEFYNMLRVTALGGGTYSTVPFTPFGNSDDYLYDGGVHALVAAAGRAYALSGDATILSDARELYEGRVLARWGGEIWDKPSAQGTLRAAVALSYLDPQGGGGGDDFLAGPGFGPSNPNEVRVYTAGGVLAVDLFAYAAGGYGTNVAAGDVDGAAPEILTGPGPGAVFGPQVRAFRPDTTPLGKVNFYAYGTLRYGVAASGALLDGDGFQEIVTGAGPGAVFGPHVRGFDYDGTTVAALSRVSFFAYGTLKYGVNAVGGDVDGDGFTEIATGPGPGVVFGPQVRGFDYDGASVAAIAKIDFLAFAAPRYGAVVASGEVDGDGFDELLAAPGPGSGPSFPARLRGYDYDGVALAPLPGFDTVASAGTAYGARLGVGDMDGSGAQEALAAAGPDPAATTTVRAFAYDGSTLSSGAGGFDTFPGMSYGATVAGAALGF